MFGLFRRIKDAVSPTAPHIERRRHVRYAVSAPLDVLVQDQSFSCQIVDVSAGGVCMAPAFAGNPGQEISVTDPQSGMSLTGEIVFTRDDRTHVRFRSEEAGIIVSAWIRMGHDAAESEARAAN